MGNGGEGGGVCESCGNPCGPYLGTNIIQSVRQRIFAQQELDLTLEIRNGDFDFRFASGFTDPFSDQIDITAISLRRPGDKSDSQLLRGDPINLLQFTSDPRLGQSLQFLEALDAAENKSEVIFTLQNLEAEQAVTVTIALHGMWKNGMPIQPIDRRVPVPGKACDPGEGEAGRPGSGVGVERRNVQPQRGPINGATYGRR